MRFHAEQKWHRIHAWRSAVVSEDRVQCVNAPLIRPIQGRAARQRRRQNPCSRELAPIYSRGSVFDQSDCAGHHRHGGKMTLLVAATTIHQDGNRQTITAIDGSACLILLCPCFGWAWRCARVARRHRRRAHGYRDRVRRRSSARLHVPQATDSWTPANGSRKPDQASSALAQRSAVHHPILEREDILYAERQAISAGRISTLRPAIRRPSLLESRRAHRVNRVDRRQRTTPSGEHTTSVRTKTEFFRRAFTIAFRGLRRFTASAKFDVMHVVVRAMTKRHQRTQAPFSVDQIDVRRVSYHVTALDRLLIGANSVL
jgi:hypothetical protein